MTEEEARGGGEGGTTRICIVYDRLHPRSGGGAERWLGRLARHLVAEGARVTYLHGSARGDTREGGVDWIGLDDRSARDADTGTRHVVPAVRFSFAVARYLRTHHRDFDLVYVHDMPILPVLGAWIALRRRGTPWVVEWIEWWSAASWRSSAGVVVGSVGYLAQRFALAVTPHAVTVSDLTTEALKAVRPRLRVTRLPGQAAPLSASLPASDAAAHLRQPQPPLAVFLGRLVSHKRAHLAVEAVLHARATLPELRLVLVGNGPEEESLRARAPSQGEGVIELRTGSTDTEVVELLARATVLVHPSEREGFGLVVVEANALGVPVVLVEGPQNAAPELISRGGGMVVSAADCELLANAIVAVVGGGEALRRDAVRNAEHLIRHRGVAASSREVLRIARTKHGPVSS